MLLYLQTQTRFPFGGKRVTRHEPKLSNFLGKQQLVRDQVVALETAAHLCASRPDVKEPLKSSSVSH